jgi:hypothetical protein
MAAEPDPGIEVTAAIEGTNFQLYGSWSGRFTAARSNIVEIPRIGKRLKPSSSLCAFPAR